MALNPLPVADENTSTPQYGCRPATGQPQNFHNERALFLNDPKLQKVTLQDRGWTPYGPEILLGKDHDDYYSQNSTHALFQHNNLPSNLFADLEIEPSENQTQQIGGAIRLQSPPSRRRAPVAVRTPPTELWCTDSQTKRNPPSASGDQRNPSETWTQQFSSTTFWSNRREDHEPRSIPSTSSIRVVPTPSILSGSNTLGLELNSSGKMKSGKPKTATKAGNGRRHYLSALYPKP